MIGIIGKKLGMTQLFNEQGQQVPCTVVEATPNPVTKVTTTGEAGFAAVELGYGAQRTARPNKKGERTPKGRRATSAELGHAKKAGLEAAPRVLKSFRLDDAPGNAEAPSYNLGDTISVEIFTPGERVKVTGTSKGRGFQGVVKRHGFHGGPNTHGNTKHRKPGSIGAGTDPSRVIKGKKMPGQYGNKQHTAISIRVEKIDAERNLIYLRGSVAGPTNGIVFVRKQGLIMMSEIKTFEAPVYTAQGKQGGTRQLPEGTFDGIVNMPVMHQAVKAFLANRRQGTAKTKTRGEVTGGNQKPWKQKGTGRARQGSTRAPNWPGGGTVFGPQPRSYTQIVPKQVRALARKSAFNARARENAVVLVDALEFSAPKTKSMTGLLEKLGIATKKVLVLTDGVKPNVYMSARNLQRAHVMPFSDVSTYHILWSDVVVIESSALSSTQAEG